MNTVLVTGATGFIGRHCLPLLKDQGYAVHGVSWQQNPDEFPGVTFHRANLLEADQISDVVRRVRPSHLLHLAWYAVPGLYWTSNENHRWLAASRELIQQFQTQGGKRLVVAGTCAEYEWSIDTDRFDEGGTPLKPATLYGQSKLSLELAVHALSRQHGLSSACGRIFMLYGPYEHPHRLVSGLIKSLLQRRPIPCSKGDQIRDVLYVKDVAAAFVALLQSSVAGPVNIASGIPLRIKDLIDQLSQTLDGGTLIRLGERPTPAGEPQTLVASVRRLHDDVGWTPRYTLDQGLEETVAWWRQRLLLNPN